MSFLLISFKFIIYIEFVGSSERPQDTIEEEEKEEEEEEEEGDRGERIPLKNKNEEKESH